MMDDQMRTVRLLLFGLTIVMGVAYVLGDVGWPVAVAPAVALLITGLADP